MDAYHRHQGGHLNFKIVAHGEKTWVLKVCWIGYRPFVGTLHKAILERVQDFFFFYMVNNQRAFDHGVSFGQIIKQHVFDIKLYILYNVRMITFSHLLDDFHALMSTFLPKLANESSVVSFLDYGRTESLDRAWDHSVRIRCNRSHDGSTFVVSSLRWTDGALVAKPGKVCSSLEEAAMEAMNLLLLVHTKDGALLMQGKMPKEALRGPGSKWLAYDEQQTLLISEEQMLSSFSLLNLN
jgi:hypothetical protein